MFKSKIIKLILIIIIPLSIYHCKSNTITPPVKIIKNGAKNEIDSLGVINYHLKESDYIVKMRLESVVTETVRDAFLIKEDQYSVASPKNGYLLTLHFSVNNPYNKELIIPVPSQFEVANATNAFFSDAFIFNKNCFCDTVPASAVFHIDENNFKALLEHTCSDSGNCMVFKPNESKHFVITFDNPFLASETELHLFGFNLNTKHSIRKYQNDVGVVIDLEHRLSEQLASL